MARGDRAVFGLVAFVALAALVPAIVVPVGVLFVTAKAFGLRIPSTKSMKLLPRSSRSAPTALLAVAISFLLLIMVALSAVAAPNEPSSRVAVGIAKLRVFPEGNSGDPATDPDYFEGEAPDPWDTDSWIVTVSGDSASFDLHVWNRHSYIAYDVFLRVPVNDLALLTSITLTVTAGESPGTTDTFIPGEFSFGTPTLSNGASWPPHGVYPADLVSFPIGDIGIFGTAMDTTTIAVDIAGAFTQGLKVHFDADGWTMLDAVTRGVILTEDPGDTNIRNPSSADTTVEIPTFSSIVVPVALATVLFILIGRRPRKPS